MKFPYQSVDKITLDLHGFYRISHEAYHEGLGISSSRIKKALISHAAYTHNEHIDSAVLAFGRAFHAALLEPDLFAEKWAVAPQFDGHPNSNVYKEAKSSWYAANVGKEIITKDDAVAIANMIEVVKGHDEYRKYPAFDSEIMAITNCPDTGLKLKCKADFFGHSILDFKTTSSGLSGGEFLNDIIKWRYHVSAAFYQDVIATVTGERMPFIVIPVTKKAPFECEFYQLSEDLLYEGRKLYKAALRRILRWQLDPSAAEKKQLRVLHANQRVFYTTKDILDYIGET